MTERARLDAFVLQIMAQGVPRAKAELAARRALGIEDAVTEAVTEVRDAREERTVVYEADKQMRALGFTVWNLSQPRATKLSAGWPDRWYTHPARGVAVWWEAKSPRGRQRPDQRVFQEHCEACGVAYVVGTEAVLYDWLITQGIATREGAYLVLLPHARSA